MRVEVLIPPSPSILSSFLYEGLFAIRSRGEDLDKIRALWEDLIKDFEESKDNKKPKQPIVFTGRNDKTSLKKLLDKKICGEPERNIENMIDLARYLKNCIFDNIVITHKIEIEKGRELVGDEQFIEERDTKSGVSLQIFKVDRYETISSFEAFSLRKQITSYADAKALYLFLLGLLNSYIDGTVVRDKEERVIGYDYYFLLFNPLSIASFNIEALIEGKGISLLMNIKNAIRNSLREALSSIRGFDEGIFATATFLNSRIIEEMKSHNINNIDLKLLRIRAEGSKRKGYTYKIYNEIPLSLDVTRRIYSNIELVKKLEKVFKELIRPAGRFLMGKDKMGDGYHAYEALRYLYIYILTENFQLLTNFYRELMNAYKIVENKSQGDALRYLRLMSWRSMRR